MDNLEQQGVNGIIEMDSEMEKRQANVQLHRAISMGDADMVQSLLSAGASPNDVNEWGDTLLMRAVRFDKKLIAQRLIDAGADVNNANRQGQTCLLTAVFNKEPDIVRSLLKAGARTNCEDNEWNTPLMFAIESGKMEIIQQIVEAGADVNYSNFDNTRDRRSDRPRNPLHAAVKVLDADILRMLLSHGADPDYTNLPQLSPLLAELVIAPRNKSSKLLILLLDHEIEMNQTGHILRWLLKCEKVDVIRSFVEYDSDLINALNRLNINYFSNQCEAGKNNQGISMLSILLDYYKSLHLLPFELNRTDLGGETPLHCAIESGFQEHVKLLLQAGADPNIPNSNGDKPLKILLSRPNRCIDQHGLIQLLVEAGTRPVIDYIEDLVRGVSMRWRYNPIPPKLNKFYGIMSREEDDPFFYFKHWNVGRLGEALCIVKYLVLFESKGPVQHRFEDRTLYELRERAPSMTSYYNACKNEIAFLRTHSFKDSITYHDVLTKEEFWKCFRSLGAFEEVNFKFFQGLVDSNVRIYIADLKIRWESAYKKYQLWDSTMKSLESILGIRGDSFHLIFSNILKHLNILDKLSLIEMSKIVPQSSQSPEDDDHLQLVNSLLDI